MDNLNRDAARHHHLAAESHRKAAESVERGDYAATVWFITRALQHSDRAYELARQAGYEGNW